MKKVRIEEVENDAQPAAVMRRLTEPLGVTDFAINYFELEPGDSFAFAYHSHEVQEEVFYVHDGTATFETEHGTRQVDTGEVIRFDREEFQRGWNEGEEIVRAIALGAPLEYGTEIKLRHCPTCEERTDNRLERTDSRTTTVAYCKECGTETGRWQRGSMEGKVP
ncbi:cupin domain-containing protein [Halobellus ordinarius]|jgi:uncharacterized cupin superfamily protein|uniref:cupin domain-containing protein n=1 Tax=Halobellus ordinarius TaxID=3075120 RepID=UPI002880895E|nr:cupin domain-containing protein [Halobellus sp. ZY16]